MLDYLRGLTGEYGENYLYLTYEKLAEEAEHKKVLNGDDIELKERSLLPDPRFAALAAFVSDQQYNSSGFAKGYQVVKVWLDSELSR